MSSSVWRASSSIPWRAIIATAYASSRSIAPLVVAEVRREPRRRGHPRARAADDLRGEPDVVVVLVGEHDELDVLDPQADRAQALLERDPGLVAPRPGVDEGQRIAAQHPAADGSDRERRGQLEPMHAVGKHGAQRTRGPLHYGSGPMPPEDRFVPRFAAEPPQDLLPYGRWAQRLQEEFLEACLRIDAEGEDLGEPGDIVWYPDRSWHGRTFVPATAPTSTASSSTAS